MGFDTTLSPPRKRGPMRRLRELRLADGGLASAWVPAFAGTTMVFGLLSLDPHADGQAGAAGHAAHGGDELALLVRHRDVVDGGAAAARDLARRRRQHVALAARFQPVDVGVLRERLDTVRARGEAERGVGER